MQHCNFRQIFSTELNPTHSLTIADSRLLQPLKTNGPPVNRRFVDTVS